MVEAEGIFLDHRPGTCGMVSPRRQLRDQQHRSSLPLPRSATVPEIATGTPTAGLTTAALPAAPAALPLMGSPSPAAASGTSRTRPFHGTREKETPKQQHKGTQQVEIGSLPCPLGKENGDCHSHCPSIYSQGHPGDIHFARRNFTWTSKPRLPRLAQPAPKSETSSMILSRLEG